MGLVLVVGALLGWFVRVETPRRAAVATIRAGGGVVSFRDEDSNAGGIWVWLYRHTGLVSCREATAVVLDNTASVPAPVADGETIPTRADLFAAVGQLGRVGRVFVPGGSITPADLEPLAQVRVDELLLLDVNEVPEPVLAVIGRLQSLLEIRIERPKVKLRPAVFGAIGQLPRLRSVQLSGLAPLSSADLAPLEHLTDLRSVTLDLAPLDGGVLDHFVALPALTGLALPRLPVTDADLERLVIAHPGLESLAVEGSQLTDAGFRALGRLPELKALSVRIFGKPGTLPAGHLTDASLQALGKLPKLGVLLVDGGRFTDPGVAALGGLPLRVLGLGSIESVAPSTLGRLLAGRAYKQIGLHGPGITDASVPPLVAAVTAGTSFLDLGYSAITDAGVATLAATPLRVLDLTGTALTDAGLAAQAPSPTLRQVQAQGTQVTLEGATAFRRLARPGLTVQTGPVTTDD